MLGRMSKWDEPDAWDTFDPQAYFHDNYSTVGEEDAAILTRLRDFLASRLHPGSALEVLDVGTGTNLYPVLAALPYAQTVHLLEFGEQNRRWLDQQVAQLGTSWDPFVEILRVKPDHARVDHRRLLSHIGSVESGSLHELPRQACDIGLMFFVAESVTDDRCVDRSGPDALAERCHLLPQRCLGTHLHRPSRVGHRSSDDWRLHRRRWRGRRWRGRGRRQGRRRPGVI